MAHIYVLITQWLWVILFIMKLNAFTETSFNWAMICITSNTEKTITDVCQTL